MSKTIPGYFTPGNYTVLGVEQSASKIIRLHFFKALQLNYILNKILHNSYRIGFYFRLGHIHSNRNNVYTTVVFLCLLPANFMSKTRLSEYLVICYV